MIHTTVSTVRTAVSTCNLHHDGHHIHDLRGKHALSDRDLAVHVLVDVTDHGIQLSWDGKQFGFRHHDVDAIAEAVRVGGDIGEWIPRWRVLILPGANPDRHTVFTLCDPEYWTPCTGEPDAPRRVLHRRAVSLRCR